MVSGLADSSQGDRGQNDATEKRSRSIGRKAMLFGVAFFLCATAGSFLSAHRGAYVNFWLPAGLFVSVLLLNRTRDWPWLVAAALPANILFDYLHGTRPAMIAGFYAANCLQAVAGAWLVRRFVAATPTLETLNEFLRFLILAAVLSTMAGATTGAATLVLAGESHSYFQSWKNWWTANSMATIMLSPFILIWFSRRIEPWPYPRLGKVVVEWVVFLSAMLFTTTYIMLSTGGILSPYKSLLIPFLLWASLRWGMRGSTLTVLVLSVAVAFLTTHFLTGLSPAQIESGEYELILNTVLILVPLVGLFPAIALTERDRTERSLRETKEQLQYILDNTTDVIFQIDLEGNFIFGNAAAERLTGRPMSQLLTMNMLQLVTPEHHRLVTERLQQRKAGDDPENSVEFTIQHKDGRLIWTELTTSGVYNQESKLVAIQGVARDITERRRTAESLTLFRSLLDHANDAIEVLEPETGRFLDVNEKACLLHGYTREEYLAQTISSLDPLFASAPAETWPAYVAKLRQTGFRVMESEHRRKDGTTFPVEINASYIQLGRDYIVAVVRDITERRQMADQRRQSQKMEAIGQLAGGVAHDFNNILGAIMMHAELSLTFPNTPTQVKDDLQEIRLAAERAAVLTRQLLMFSRKQVMQTQTLDLNDVVTSMSKLLRRVIGEYIGLQLHLHPTPLITRADAGMLDQVVLNLAVNARDAMSAGGNLRIETKEANVDEQFEGFDPDAGPGRYVCLSVCDTGTGIRPEILARIFEPFFTTKEAGKGTGLGLATVFGIVKQHRGFLKVNTEVGRGTKFHVFLPASTTPPESPAPINKPNPKGGTETILLVEDEVPMRSVMRSVLEQSGYEVIEAANGVEALDLYQKADGTVAMLVTDLIMPAGITGHELARRLRENNPRLKIIFMSGYSSEIAGREMELTAGENFLQKPFTPDHLLETVRTGLDG